MANGEDELVDWLRGRLPADAARVPVGIGDDMAAVRVGGALVAITADMLLDGVHFESGRDSVEHIGRKAIACSLSDCAGMACHPRAATVSLALPRAMTLDDIKRLYEGMAGVAAEFQCLIVGGDTTRWTSGLAIDVAMLAEPMAPRGPIRRSGAEVGDIIYVSGLLGGSILGKHLVFPPRLKLAARLAAEPQLHALMDISDGLALDLHRLCRASGCHAELSAEQLEPVISPEARLLAQRSGRPALDHALSDGEDFELLVVGGQELGQLGLDLIEVGRIATWQEERESTLMLYDASGEAVVLEPRGYDHLRP
jgi:thiamine-monophosphate kinase